MPAFVRPFTRSSVTHVGDVTITLPDPPHVPGDPIVRPNVARYAGGTLVLLHIQPSAGSFNLLTPVTGTVRRVDLDGTTSGMLEGLTQLLEIEPLPFSMAPTLKALKPGSPTFYIGYTSPDMTQVDNERVLANHILANVNGDAYVGVLFQDGAALSPWAWIELLGKAMADAGDTAGANDWNDLLQLYATAPRTVRVLDHTGRPFASTAFSVSTNGQPPTPVTTNANGEFTLNPGEITLSWNGNPVPSDTALPVQSFYEGLFSTPTEANFSSAPGGSIILPSQFNRGHLQVFDLSRWLALSPDPAIARYHTNCRLEPLVDGVASFKRIVDDLVKARGPGGSAYFSGLIFNNFSMDGTRPNPFDPGDLDTTLIELTKFIRKGGGEVRMQFDKFLQLKDSAAFEGNLQLAAILVVILATSGLMLLSLIDRFKQNFPSDELGYGVAWMMTLLSPILLSLVDTSAFESVIEPSYDIFNALNAIDEDGDGDPDDPYIAIWGRHPVQMLDNPLADLNLLPGFEIEDIQDRFGSWHQKIQAITRIDADTAGNKIIGYVGGIDINKNRMDSPGHQAAGPYHDVHTRVTGAAAWDIHHTWRERYAFEKQQYLDIDGDSSVPALTTSLPDYRTTPSDYPAQSQKHIVRIARTLPPLSNPPPLALPPEKATYDIYLRAVKEAREYIYLEDQYFTPNTSPEVQDGPGSRNPDCFFDALLEAANEAADHCKRLVVIVPREGDQPFGQSRRAFLFSLLRQAWGDRVVIDVPLRRPLLPDPGRVAAKGRALLQSDITPFDTEIVVGPAARIPTKPPFWLWIYGELMLCEEVENPGQQDDPHSKRLTVIRGADQLGNPRWGAKARPHKEGAPVTFSQLKGPYVHAKVIMVDDIFVGIGSTNITRRAFFHEGEIHAFAVPEQLRAAPDNPALALRTALWAEHLGIPPTMGPALLGDPMMAFEYFRRSFYAANRSVPVEVVNEVPYIVGTVDPDSKSYLGLLGDLLGIAPAAILQPFWNTFSDATTDSDPLPTPGPFA